VPENGLLSPKLVLEFSALLFHINALSWSDPSTLCELPSGRVFPDRDDLAGTRIERTSRA
jgi:hypothetical protein